MRELSPDNPTDEVEARAIRSRRKGQRSRRGAAGVNCVLIGKPGRGRPGRPRGVPRSSDWCGAAGSHIISLGTVWRRPVKTSSDPPNGTGDRHRAIEFLARALLLTLSITVTIWVESSILQRFSSSSKDAIGVLLRDLLLGPPPDPTSSAVLLYDEDLLPGLEREWPPGFDALTNVATQLWCEGAATATFDFTFTKSWRLDPSMASGAEGRFVDRLHNLAGDGPSNESARRVIGRACLGDRLRPPMKAFVAPPADDRWPAGADDLVVGVQVDAEGYYPRENVRAGNGTLETAAFRSLDVLCAVWSRRGRMAAAGCGKPRPSGLMQRDSWVTPADQLRFSFPGSNSSKPTCVGRGFVQSLKAIGRLAWDGAQRNWRTCPPVLTFGPNALVDPANANDWLAGRAVFVGGRIGDADLVETSFHHGLPGVYMHALALDQLLDGQAVSRSPGELEQFSVLFAVVFLARSLEVAIVASVGARWCSGFALARVRITTGLIAFFMIVVAAIGFDWPPGFCIRYGLLILIGLGFPSLDPFELLANLTHKMRGHSDSDFKAALAATHSKGGDEGAENV